MGPQQKAVLQIATGSFVLSSIITGVLWYGVSPRPPTSFAFVELIAVYLMLLAAGLVIHFFSWLSTGPDDERFRQS